MYKINYSKQAIKTLRRLPKNLSQHIIEKIDSLAKDPHSAKQVKTLQGSEGYRLRVRNWRIIYTINDQEIGIWIIKIAPRGAVYKKRS